MPNGVIDLRGSRTGLEGLGEALSNLLRDPNDRIREFFLANPDIGKQMATNIEASQRRTTPESLAAQGLGKADVEFTEAQLGGFLDEDVLPLEIQKELLQTFAETPEEVRTREVGEAGRGMVTAEQQARVATQPTRRALRAEEALPLMEEAEIAAEIQRTAGVEAEARAGEAQRTIDIRRIMDEGGFGAEAEAATMILEQQYRRAGLELGVEGMGEFAQLYEGASPSDRRIMTASLAGPQGALIGQKWLSDARYDREVELAELRGSFNTQDPLEIRKKVVDLKISIRKERDRIVDRINEIADDKGRRDELVGLIDDMRDLGVELMRVDPTLAVQTADEIRGIIRRHKVTGVEFGLKDFTETNAGDLEAGAQMLASFDMDPARVTQLRNSLVHPGTGVVNEPFFLAILERANMIMAGEDMEGDAAELIAAMGPMGAGDEERSAARVQEALLEFNAAASSGELGPNALAAMEQKVTFMRFVHFLRSSGGVSSDLSGFLDIERGIGR